MDENIEDSQESIDDSPCSADIRIEDDDDIGVADERAQQIIVVETTRTIGR